jgi:hypothetical protein
MNCPRVPTSSKLRPFFVQKHPFSIPCHKLRLLSALFSNCFAQDGGLIITLALAESHSLTFAFTTSTLPFTHNHVQPRTLSCSLAALFCALVFFCCRQCWSAGLQPTICLRGKCW